MRIGVPKEIKNHEYRVGLTPASVRELTLRGHKVLVQTGAGASIGLSNEQYLAAGAELAPDAATVFATADMIVKVKEPQPQECAMLRPGQILYTYLHLAPDLAQTQDLLRSGAYHFLDRGAPGLTPEDIGKIYRQIFSADCYFASANAVTEAGEVLNVDGNANRVAAITFGPASVILVVGSNKIVKDLAAADARVKAVAAPANAKRLSCKTPCAVTGQCENCQSPGRICCTYVLHRYQRVPGRIKVILVGQELGY